MLEQVSNAITFYAQFLVSGAAGTGLTITCTIKKGSDGSAVVTGAAATELFGGLYKYTLASGSVDTEDDYLAVFNEAAATADQTDVPAMWTVGKAGVENLDASISGLNDPSAATIADAVWDETMADHVTAGSTGEKLNAAGAATDPLTNAVPGSYGSGTAGAALGRIGSDEVTIVSPVAADSAVTIVRGDDYKAADGRALEWSGTNWPSLTGATILLTVRDQYDAQLLQKAGSVVDADTARVELLTTDTNLAIGTTHEYDVQATLSGGSVVTLVRGSFTVLEDQSR
jgi:hypothetical protein